MLLIAEHRGLPPSPSVLENTRTIRTNSIIQLMSWQVNFHAAHHAYPSVPFWQLSKAQNLIDGTRAPQVRARESRTHNTFISKAEHSDTTISYPSLCSLQIVAEGGYTRFNNGVLISF